MNRRMFLGGMFATPAIVHAESLMPIFSRGQWTLAYNITHDGYDVIFPSGYIKREYEVWPELFQTYSKTWPAIGKYPENTINWMAPIHDRDWYGNYRARIDKKRSEYPILTGEKKRAAYAPFLGITPKAIEQRATILDYKADRDVLARQDKLPFDPLATEIIEKQKRADFFLHRINNLDAVD